MGSKKFSLNSLDYPSIRRGLYVSGAGFLLTVAPMLMGYQYVIAGYDITPLVFFALSNLVNVLRKFVQDNSSDEPIA